MRAVLINGSLSHLFQGVKKGCVHASDAPEDVRRHKSSGSSLSYLLDTEGRFREEPRNRVFLKKYCINRENHSQLERIPSIGLKDALAGKCL